jgi:hypothetical protein
MHRDPADGLADLDSDSTIGVSDDAIELCCVHRSRVDVVAARALTKGLNRRLRLEYIDSSEVDETDSARSKGRNLVLGSPITDRTQLSSTMSFEL